jgi:hypothetical protein
MYNIEEIKRLLYFEGNTTHSIQYSILDEVSQRVNSDQAKITLKIADTISDMILFHKKVRNNGQEMSKPWSE